MSTQSQRGRIKKAGRIRNQRRGPTSDLNRALDWKVDSFGGWETCNVRGSSNDQEWQDGRTASVYC